MKVLMFGWEFPPHISGGLGTACFGLTQALAAEDTKILFVVPRAGIRGSRDPVRLISASEVILSLPESLGTLAQQGKLNFKISRRKAGGESEVQTIVVSSPITPYTSVQEFATLGNRRWNDAPIVASPVLDIRSKKFRYQFSGGYGPGLLEEVRRYGEVASEISRKKSFDVIHAHDWLTYPAGISAKQMSGKPLVVHVHATEYDRAGENIDPQIYQVERAGMEEADRVIAVSEWTRKIIVSRYLIPENKVEVVHNGISDNKSDGLVSMPRLGKQMVTFLGRVTYQKGPQYFVEAARKVLQRFPDVHFVMAGSGDLLGKMIERVAELKMSAHFHFTGFLKGGQVDSIWSASSVYVMPSVSEPFGIAPLEAMRAGIPVIISKQSGVAEVVKNAIKVDFWDVDALSNAISNILVHTSLRRTLAMKSHQELQQITWSRAATKINRLYHELAR